MAAEILKGNVLIRGSLKLLCRTMKNHHIHVCYNYVGPYLGFLGEH